MAVLSAAALAHAAPDASSAAGAAGPAGAAGQGLRTVDGQLGRRLAVDVVPHARAAPAEVSATIYLERCIGGCVVHSGSTNDARTHTSTIPKFSTQTVGEFMNTQRMRGAAADAEWSQLVQCMREVYSPYNVVVTDVKPAGTYHEAIIAGAPTDIGLASDILGVAPLSTDCRAIDNVISFTFANQHPPERRIQNICWTAAQESAHAFGLDHEFAFSSGRSACSDPMTYRTDCGGQKFFRNEKATCGEYAARACKCGATQNSHQRLLSVFGPGTSIAGAPTVTLLSPVTGGALGIAVDAEAGAARGIARVEAWFNGYKWAVTPGVAFGVAGQPNPSGYRLPIESALPDGIIDVQAIAYDDLGAAAASSVATITKGAPCVSASTCAVGQKCEAGRCFWDPPMAEVGDACEYRQFCKSGVCRGDAGQKVCSQDCVPGDDATCPEGTACVEASTRTGGECERVDGGGCCSAQRGSTGAAASGGLAALVLGAVLRRRRRR